MNALTFGVDKRRNESGGKKPLHMKFIQEVLKIQMEMV